MSYFKQNHDRQNKLLKMLNNKMTRNLLLENEVIDLNFIGKLNVLLKSKDENEFYQVVSKLMLDDESVVAFTFNDIDIRLNVYTFTDLEYKSSESLMFFSFTLLEEYSEQQLSDQEMDKWLKDHVIILDI